MMPKTTTTGLWLLACLVAGLLCAPASWATFANLKSYKEAYPGKEPKAYSCKVCHEHPVGRADDLNAYGAALEKLKGAGAAKQLTVDDYRAIEKDDADGDGASNVDEINAGTDPSDPKSVPEAAANKQGSWLLEPSAMQRFVALFEQQLIATAEAAPSTTQTKEQPTAQTGEEKPSTTATKTSKPSEPEAPKAEYVGVETCATCHVKQYQEFKESTHARIAIPGETKAQGCETCHGPGSLHVEAGGGRGVGGIINPRKDPTICFSCHLDKKAEFRLPYHHPVMEGKMGCVDCHDAHSPDVRPWSTTSLNDVNQVCFKCHKEQRGPFVWEHEALREGCTTCHKVHGSINDKMLLVRDSNLCLRCHAQVTFPTIGNSGHGSRLPNATCFSAGCHTGIHGSNFDKHLRY